MATDALLVRRAIDGDERALRTLWSQYAPRVDAVVRRLVGDPDEAEDVAQEVWIQIFRALPGFRGGCAVWHVGPPDRRQPHPQRPSPVSPYAAHGDPHRGDERNVCPGQ